MVLEMMDNRGHFPKRKDLNRQGLEIIKMHTYCDAFWNNFNTTRRIIVTF